MRQTRVSVAGMPLVDDSAPPLSHFEFWPAWAFYAPVWAWILILMIRHRSIRLPLLANPSFPAGGLVGEEKSLLFSLLKGPERQRLPGWIVVKRWHSSVDQQLPIVESQMSAAGLAYPVVAKPDIGCRGAGVRPIRTRECLERYLREFPAGGRLLLQRMAEMEGEAGIFYVRAPGQTRGTILSLTLKYFPHVVGDGRSTLRELILRDPRAGRISQLYLGRFANELDQVLPAGEARRLIFAGSHSRGAIFRNGNEWITEAMRAKFDAIADGIDGFHFGRFDVRFAEFEALRRGEDFVIIEFNGAGAEATHIWDSRTKLLDAWQALFAQFSILFRIGAANRARGFRPDGWIAFFRRWRREKAMARRYPSTE